MKLSKRLQAVADCVWEGARVADVGADHAKLSAWLAVHKGARCVATDIHAAPLERAQARFPAADFPGLQFRLGDGLRCVGPDEVDAIVIAGLGGETIADILSRSPWSREKPCVLQPASRAYLLRRFCYERGYEIRGERVIRDAGRWYPVIQTAPGEPAGLTADYCFLSRELRACASPETIAYVQRQMAFLRAVTPKKRGDPRAGQREQARFFSEALRGLELWKDGLPHESDRVSAHH